MKKLFNLLFVLFGLTISLAYATPSNPKAGTDYQILTKPSVSSIPAGKIEITEFFWYGCPHCYTFEPIFNAWAEKQKADVIIKRVPVAFREDFITHQKLYHVVDALGLTKQLTEKIFATIQKEKNYLLTPEEQADFLSQHGISKKRFFEEYNSFEMPSKVRQDSQLAAYYKIDGVPSIIVQGKYETSPAMTNNFDGTTQVLDFLIQQIRAKKM